MKAWALLRTLASWLFRRKRVEDEMDQEIRAHIERRAEDLARQGTPRAEAERQARIEFGGGEKYKEECRQAMGTHFFDTLLQDLRFGIRTLRKSPGFALVAILTLALGIAVNATMFSMVSAFLLRRPPGLDPQHVVVVSSVDPNESFLPDASPVSAANYLAWRKASHVFADLAAADESRAASLTEKGQSEAVRSAAVTLDYFSVLGVSPQLGRTFASGEDQPGRDHVVILSHDLWERRFGSDPAILGRTIRISREDYDVVGVMPAEFRLLGFTPQLWTPLVLTQADETAAAHKNRSLYLFARLKPGVTVEQARAEMATLARRAEEDFPETEKRWGTAVRTLPDFLVYSFGIRDAIVVLMTAVGFVLMIACANVAGLLLARSAGRRKELGIRVALGAGRLRIARQLLTEGLVIAIFGGGAGLLLAHWGIGFIRASLVFNEAISAVPLNLDWNVALFAVAASLVSALFFGVAPALKASRADVNLSLKEEGRAASMSRGRSRLRRVLVTAEIALALFLLVGVGLLIRGIYLIEHQSLGFQAEHLLTAYLTLDEARYKDVEKKEAFVQAVIGRLREISGAAEVAASSDLPASGANSVALRIKDQPTLPTEQLPNALDVVVTPGYFRTAGIPVLRGRTFTEMDTAAAPRAIVVNQEFVHRYLQDREPLGKQIQFAAGEASQPWGQIVGVAGNVKTYSQQTRNDPQVYEAFLQRPVASFALLVRAAGDPDSLAADLREAVARVDGELPLARVMSMPAVIDRQKGGTPFFERAMGSFAVLALILAAIGIYGLVAYSVGQRMQEIGIRMAMGARSSNVLRMVLWDGLKMSATGAVIGLLLALPLPKVFDALFSGILHVREPWLYGVVPAAILLVAMLAAYVPARRAMKVDPMVALRSE